MLAFLFFCVGSFESIMAELQQIILTHFNFLGETWVILSISIEKSSLKTHFVMAIQKQLKIA